MPLAEICRIRPLWLWCRLLFLPPGSSADQIVFTPEFCRDVGVKCFENGLYQDAWAFSQHSAAGRQTPSMLYLRGLSELVLKRTDDAMRTASQLRQAGGSSVEVIGSLRERLNGPLAVQLVRMIDQR